MVRFGCYHERNPKACHLLGDYWEGIKKDFSKEPTENHCLLSLYEQNCIFLDLENLLHLGHNNPPAEPRVHMPGGNRTRACLTACRRATPHPPWATPYPNWTTLYPNCTTLHPFWSTPHPVPALRPTVESLFCGSEWRNHICTVHASRSTDKL